MLNKVFILLLLFSSFLFAKVGDVTLLEGEAFVTRDNSTLRLNLGDSVENGDFIETKINSKVKISFVDDTVVTIGKESSLNIDDYVFDNSNLKSEFSVVKGAFHTITGQIAKTNPSKFKLKTKNATIGVRGTEIYGDQTNIFCTQGAITVEAFGTVREVAQGSYVTTPEDAAPSEAKTIDSEKLDDVNSKLNTNQSSQTESTKTNSKSNQEQSSNSSNDSSSSTSEQSSQSSETQTTTVSTSNSSDTSITLENSSLSTNSSVSDTNLSVVDNQNSWGYWSSSISDDAKTTAKTTATDTAIAQINPLDQLTSANYVNNLIANTQITTLTFEKRQDAIINPMVNNQAVLSENITRNQMRLQFTFGGNNYTLAGGFGFSARTESGIKEFNTGVVNGIVSGNHFYISSLYTVSNTVYSATDNYPIVGDFYGPDMDRIKGEIGIKKTENSIVDTLTGTFDITKN